MSLWKLLAALGRALDGIDGWIDKQMNMLVNLKINLVFRKGTERKYENGTFGRKNGKKIQLQLQNIQVYFFGSSPQCLQSSMII